MRGWQHGDMNTTPCGDRIRTARLKKQWGQPTLARLAKMTPPRLSNLENNHRHPTFHEWHRLSQHLDLGPYVWLGGERRPGVAKQWRASLPPLGRGPHQDISARYHSALATFGPLAEETSKLLSQRPDVTTCERFLHQAMLDSGHEYLLWTRILACGAQPSWASPLKAGFRSLSVIDSGTKMAAGDLKHPCLEWQSDEFSALFFPQVTVDTRKAYYRLDGLVCLLGEGYRLWVDLELDGEGHVGSFDQVRSRRLGLPRVQLLSEELLAPDFAELLNSKFLPLVRERKAV